MKKLPSLTLERILLFSGFSLALTVAGFWHLRQNVNATDHLAALQQGVSTCFARVTQTFTAAMIRDLRSPYLNKDFMALSDECLREGAKTAQVDLTLMPKASRLNNELVSETYWFHEKVQKVLATAPLNPKEAFNLTGVSEKYAKIEGLKLDLADQLDVALVQGRAARVRDEFLMGGAFCLFMAALASLALRQGRTMRAMREIEKQALSLLNTGTANVGAMVDQLLGRALTVAEMPVTLRVFRDYHGDMLERVTGQRPVAPTQSTTAEAQAGTTVDETTFVTPTTTPAPTQATASATVTTETPVEGAVVAGVDVRKILVNQATRQKISMDAQDAQVVADEESVGQVLQSMGQRYHGWGPRLNGVSGDNLYTIRLSADGVCLNSSELEYAARVGASTQGVDVNIVMAVDLAREEGLVFHIANCKAEDGSIKGSEAVLELPMVSNRNLTSVVRGKKRDLAKGLRNLVN